tara:strand:- start:300 stop:809 length:510 start_codon:yes stop_codon:yes gene_type:complete
MRIVGIDPGLTGAVACATINPSSGEVIAPEVHDLPVTDFVDQRKVPDPVGLYDLLRTMTPDLIVLEHVEARPGRGSVSSWRFASGFGATMAACQLAVDGPRVHLVRPSIWKSALGLSSDKAASLTAARSAFPQVADQLKRVKDDGRAEALLLIQYYRQHLLRAGEMEVI